MSDTNKGKNIYISSTNTAVVETEQELTFATATLTGGDTAKSYTCTAKLDVTATGAMKSALEAGEAFIKFSSDAAITGYTAGPHDLKDAFEQQTITIKLTKDTTDTASLKGNIYVVNTESQQNSATHNLAGKDLKVTVNVTGLKCNADE